MVLFSPSRMVTSSMTPGRSESFSLMAAMMLLRPSLFGVRMMRREGGPVRRAEKSGFWSNLPPNQAEISCSTRAMDCSRAVSSATRPCFPLM